MPRVDVDGWLGEETRDACAEILWALGLGDERELPAELPRDFLRKLENPDERTRQERDRGRLRRRSLGPEITASHLMQGVQLLSLIGDWGSWVDRRTTSVAYYRDEPRELVETVTMEFRLPPHIRASDADEPQKAALPVPIAVVSKWKCARFDIRDELGRGLSVPARAEMLPIATGALIVLAYQTVCGEWPPTDDRTMPRALEEDLRAIVNEDAAAAHAIWLRLDRNPPGASELDDELRAWRTALVVDDAFMELAWTLAVCFVMMTLCLPPFDRRRTISYSRAAGVQLPRRAPSSIRRARQYVDGLRTRTRDEHWPHGKSTEREPVVGHLQITALCNSVVRGARTAPAQLECATVTVTSPKGARIQFVADANGVIQRGNLPIGTYTIEISPRDGFRLEGPSRVDVSVSPSRWAQCSFRCRQIMFVGRGPVETSGAVPGPPRNRRIGLSRTLGWRSSTLLFRFQLREGTSQHFEFIAPPGFQVTRAKLVDSRRGDLDISLQSGQRTHLYVPASLALPGPAFALVNLRPRASTIARPAVLTAVLAAVALFVTAIAWEIAGSPRAGAIALILAIPGAWSAYVSQTYPDGVSEHMLTGLRTITVAPGMLAFAGAAIVLLADGRLANCALWLATAFAAMCASSLLITLRQARKPREQQPTTRAQGRSFAERYLQVAGEKGE